MLDKGKTDPNAADDLRARLDALKADLGEVASREKAQGGSRNAKGNDNAIGKGLRAGSELIAGVIVGCAIGYFLDGQLGVSPLFLIIFMMMGMAAGFWNIYRMAARTSGGQTGKDR